jgi:hypothetical protein
MQLRRLFLLLLLALVALSETQALGDGGAVRTIERVGGMQVSVFTSPAVLVPGEADVSVLVQDAKTMAAISNVDIEVTLTPRGRPYAVQRVRATAETATNKLFQASHVTLEAGSYDLVVDVRVGEQKVEVGCKVEVGAPPTKAAAFWPWFSWPLVPILVFAVDQWRKRN